jgi:3-phosphoshikimate 1-carboxyvinyltransferase
VITLDYPLGKVLDKAITLPGSKYLANRLLILAALSDTKTSLNNMPHNEDIDTSIKGLGMLGAKFTWQGNHLDCEGFEQHNDYETTGSEITLNSSHSGSFSRFVMPLLGLFKQTISLGGSDKMNTRPMAELFRVLESLGVTITSENQFPASTLPVKVLGPIKGGAVEMEGLTSSQYISALLMVGGKLDLGLEINLTTEPVSKPYLQMTINLLKLFGVIVEADVELRHFSIKPNQIYSGIDYDLESDPSSASYFLAAAAITGGHICISNFHPENSVQGEAQFATVLESMGCTIWQDNDGYHCQGPETLQGVTVDMGDMPDVAQTLAVVAIFAEGETVITNIANLAFKESNRIEDTATEIRKTGINVTTTSDSITIEGGNPRETILDTHDDHRMAMSLGLIALRVNNVQMRDEEVVGKSFPTYWQYLEQLGYSLVKV